MMKRLRELFNRSKVNQSNVNYPSDGATDPDIPLSDPKQEYGAVFRTVAGNTRMTNEDAILRDEGRNLFVVCDGMGGHNAGEVASKIAVDTIDGYFTDEILASNHDIEGILKNALKSANTKIKEQADANTEYSGMGSTGTICYVSDNVLYVANVGDSRVYLVSDGDIKQLTVDHSEAADSINACPTPEITDVRNHSLKNRLTSVLGFYHEIPEIGYRSVQIKKDDVFVVSSDGMWETMSDNEIHEIVADNRLLNDAIGKLLTKSLKNGGRDNISIIMYRRS